jgi:hypothetical protein
MRKLWTSIKILEDTIHNILDTIDNEGVDEGTKRKIIIIIYKAYVGWNYKTSKLFAKTFYIAKFKESKVDFSKSYNSNLLTST